MISVLGAWLGSVSSDVVWLLEVVSALAAVVSP